MIIFRTHPDHIDEVFNSSKHALAKKPRNISQGELILISQTIAQSKDGVPPIRYVMKFVKICPDTSNESTTVFRKRWRYMVYGENCYQLKRPFDIRKIHGLSGKNYSQGGTIVYVAPEDEVILRQGRWLE